MIDLILLKEQYLILKKKDIDLRHGIKKKFKLTIDEADIIYRQTKGGYKYLNRELRNNSNDQDVLYIRDKLNSSLDKITDYKGYVYRTLTIDDIEKFSSNYKENNIVQYKAFVSACEHGAEKTTQQLANIKFKIKSKHGKSIKLLSNFKEEKEILFKAGSKFKIKKYKRNEPDYWYHNGSIEIEMDEI